MEDVQFALVGISTRKISFSGEALEEDIRFFEDSLYAMSPSPLLDEVLDLIYETFNTEVDLSDIDTRRKKAYFHCENGLKISIPIEGTHVITNY